MTIQEFIKTIAQTLDLTQCFAICSYVPDLDATKLAYETFPNSKKLRLGMDSQL